MAFPYNNYNGYGYPYQQQAQAQQQPQSPFVRVSGEMEAYNYPMAPGVTMMFYDGTRIYVKTTDASPVGGFQFDKFIRVTDAKPDSEKYVTREEFEAFKAAHILEANHAD